MLTHLTLANCLLITYRARLLEQKEKMDRKEEVTDEEYLAWRKEIRNIEKVLRWLGTDFVEAFLD